MEQQAPLPKQPAQGRSHWMEAGPCTLRQASLCCFALGQPQFFSRERCSRLPAAQGPQAAQQTPRRPPRPAQVPTPPRTVKTAATLCARAFSAECCVSTSPKVPDPRITSSQTQRTQLTPTPAFYPQKPASLPCHSPPFRKACVRFWQIPENPCSIGRNSLDFCLVTLIKYLS